MPRRSGSVAARFGVAPPPALILCTVDEQPRTAIALAHERKFAAEHEPLSVECDPAQQRVKAGFFHIDHPNASVVAAFQPRNAHRGRNGAAHVGFVVRPRRLIDSQCGKQTVKTFPERLQLLETSRRLPGRFQRGGFQRLALLAGNRFGQPGPIDRVLKRRQALQVPRLVLTALSVDEVQADRAADKIAGGPRLTSLIRSVLHT
ncbi:MAG TPA: hypothetical protein VL635_11410 [Trinickia sp.]|nr:hypothetical protein [Trinickia sp.]